MTTQGQSYFSPARRRPAITAAAWAAVRTTPETDVDHDQAPFLIRGGSISRTACHAEPSLREGVVELVEAELRERRSNGRA